MKHFLLALAAFASAPLFAASRTANQDWVKEHFIAKEDIDLFAAKTNALFFIDLNTERGGRWRAFELKASTNNFQSLVKRVVFWGISDEADNYVTHTGGAGSWTSAGGMRLYVNLSEDLADPAKKGDSRIWQRIPSTVETVGKDVMRLAVIVANDMCIDRGGWLSSENEELLWSYTRIDDLDFERDDDGRIVWHAVQPVRWYRNLPGWAK